MNHMSAEDVQRIIKLLEETPQVIGRLIARVADEGLTWKQSEKEFSVVEHSCHLRDLEQEGYGVRIEKTAQRGQSILAGH